MADAGRTQLRMAETEKYPHVTYFLNGGREEPYAGEDRIMVPSPKVATYDLQPEMSAPELTAKAVEAINSGKYDMIVLNFANPDMVGHTGSLPAAIKAVETVDTGLGKIADAIQKQGGALLVTADHGNCELMRDPETGGPHTSHTTNPVPVLLMGGGNATLADGRLADLAPTMLELMELPKPKEMTGTSLLRKSLEVLQPQHIGHRIKPGLLVARPERRVQRAAREDHAVLGAVHQLDPLGGPGEDHAVLADHGAAAQRRKADVARLARAGLAVAAARRMRREIDAAAFRRRAAEHQRGAGRRVDLLVVMHLEDFDVEAVVERLGHALGQRREQIDAEAHVAGLHDHGALGGLRDLRLFVAECPVVPTMCTLPAVSAANAAVAFGMVKSMMPSALASSALASAASLMPLCRQPGQHAGVLADAAASPRPRARPRARAPWSRQWP